MEAIRVRSNKMVKNIARATVKMRAGFLNLPAFNRGTCFILLNIPNSREAEKTLVITPDTVATIASKLVSHVPHSPNIGCAASANE